MQKINEKGFPREECMHIGGRSHLKWEGKWGIWDETAEANYTYGENML